MFKALEEDALSAVDKLNTIPIRPLVPLAILDEKDPRDTSFGGGLLPMSNHYPEWLDSKQENLVDCRHNEIVLSMKLAFRVTDPHDTSFDGGLLPMSLHCWTVDVRFCG
ncbi:hypothetical protein Fmac_008549 [Flemingia macrophylla]|uniref:Uncharacterized protein n=1 Tax=Flemingia macrophylla TaxID=520843 RepID=A0ABD1MXP6_9FABA